MKTVVPFPAHDRVENPASGPAVGEVILLGAGPGDPELMTIKGMRALQQAEVVIYDSLANPELLDFCPAQCRRIHVGKRKNCHSVSQARIGELLVAHAGSGRRVVRLKGGDPFVFGRGGEEVEVLARAGIPCRVIPGVTAATGCGAFAGIPLTHRDCAQSLTLMTAHRRDGEIELNWDLAMLDGQTLAIYMGLSAAPAISDGMIARGKSAATPVAVVANATLPTQQVLISSLGTLAGDIAASSLPSPALILVGDVVNHRFEVAAETSAEKAVSSA